MAVRPPRFIPSAELQEELLEKEAKEEEYRNISNQEKVIGLLNEAQLVDPRLDNKEKKIECLSKVREIIINQEQSLLDSFFEEVMAFHHDGSIDVKKFVIGFIEDACKTDNHLFPRGISMLCYILKDESRAIQKRVIVCIMQLYRLAVLYILKFKSAKSVSNSIHDMWKEMNGIKQEIFNMLSVDNDGIKVMTIKFIEMVVLTQTKKDSYQVPIEGSDEGIQDVSIDMIPLNHPIMKVSELKEESGTMLRKLLELTTSQDVSSISLMTCISSLSVICRKRSIHMSTVVQTFEIVHGNLPTHFTSSQINSVAKHLKSQLLTILRSPLSYDYHPQLSTLLTALGCSQSEISRNIAKRPRIDNEGGPPSKKSKVGSMATTDRQGDSEVKGNAFLEAVDVTTSELKELLVHHETVVDLVIDSMPRLPYTVPVAFRHSFTPIAAAGTDVQITQIARLLASQLTSVGLGTGAEAKGIQGDHQREDTPILADIIKKEESEENIEGTTSLEESMDQLQYLGSILGLPSISDPCFPMAYASFFGSLPESGKDGGKDSIKDGGERPNLVAIPTKNDPDVDVKPMEVDTSGTGSSNLSSVPQKLKKIKQFDLSSVVKPNSRGELEKMSVASFMRILEAENTIGHQNQIRNKLIIRIILQMGGDYNTVLYNFILDNFKSRLDLAQAWLYALYSVRNNYYVNTSKAIPTYDDCLIMLLKGVHKTLDSRDRLFTRLLLEAPLVTPRALAIIRSYCRDEERAFLGLATLRDLIVKKPQGVTQFMDALLEVTMSDLELARVQALHIIKKFYSRPDLSVRIEKYAIQALQHLLSDHPLFQQTQSEIEVSTQWSEDTVKMCIGPLLTLLPLNSNLLKELAVVYTSTSANIKRILLKLLDQPVRVIGMHSPQLLELVETCPKGAETLIMRILYILTENVAPSQELVKHVRELYQRSSGDVRFLIPVLQGLTKQEILVALPKFIKLSPNVTKGVFERLLISYKGEGSQLVSPISPSELLIALHDIDCKGDETMMKAVVRATNLCFQEKSVYTQEVLAVVLQQLIDHTPLPLLYMRTVIQSLGVCPRLINFVMTILTKLISKQVWKSSKVWQGFIKCCEVTVPHSFQVIVQLPPKQLENLLNNSSQLKDPFIKYIQSLSSSQKASIPRSVLVILERLTTSDTGQPLKKRRTSEQGAGES